MEKIKNIDSPQPFQSLEKVCQRDVENTMKCNPFCCVDETLKFKFCCNSCSHRKNFPGVSELGNPLPKFDKFRGPAHAVSTTLRPFLLNFHDILHKRLMHSVTAEQ